MADVMVDGWTDTVADRAASYVSEETFGQLIGRDRHRRCRALADAAERILAAKGALHDLVGRLTGWLVSLFGWGSVEQRFARALAAKLPLPPDAKLVATARGLQVTGVLICILNGDDLGRCQCFIDLSLTETKTRVKALLVAAQEDWQGLAAFTPASGPLARRAI